MSRLPCGCLAVHLCATKESEETMEFEAKNDESEVENTPQKGKTKTP